MRLIDKLSGFWHNIQKNLFPWLEEELDELTEKQKQLVSILELIRVEEYITLNSGSNGRPPKDRAAIARAFVAKSVYNIPTTKDLLERLRGENNLRIICGWARKCDVPSESKFSRVFTEFAQRKLPERVHEILIEKNLSNEIIGHISRDGTAIEAREKPKKKNKLTSKKDNKPKKKGRPKKGEERVKEPTRLERQSSMKLEEMLDDLPKDCDKGSKKNSKGYIEAWNGYKLHIDAADGLIPISCVLTSASTHDSQVALPLMEMTSQRVNYLYDLDDSAYDSPIIREHIKSLGHVPIIDVNPRRNTVLKEEIEAEAKRRKILNFEMPEERRYNERSNVERVNGRLKDDFGGRMVRVRGHAKVMAHLMFGILALTADQLIRLIT